jgi:DNA repair protein RecO (recombination protein O)
MLEEVEGIVISERAYGETSKIINVLTKEHGIIGMMVKGCRSLKSPLRSVTDKLTYGIFSIYYKKDKLSILSEVNVINPFKEIKKDIDRISYASFLIELSEQVIRQTTYAYVYSILIDALIKINEKFDPLVIANILELKYLDFLGVLPILDSCSNCGNKSDIITLSSDKGGYLCSKCRANEPIISKKSIQLIRMYYYVELSKIEKLEVSSQSKQEINDFLDNYYDRYTGLYLKSKQFIKNLNKLL